MFIYYTGTQGIFQCMYVYTFSFLFLLPFFDKNPSTHKRLEILFKFKLWRQNQGRDSRGLLMMQRFAHGALLRRTTLYDLTTIAQYLIIVFCLPDMKPACWLLGLQHGLSAQLGSTWVQTPMGQMIILCTF